MKIYSGRCLCGQCQFFVEVEQLSVYACHCSMCQKWSGGVGMYLEARITPSIAPTSLKPSCFRSSTQGKRWFCPSCGCSLWKEHTAPARYFVPWTILSLSEYEKHQLVLAAEIYIETQPAFWRLTGQYARFRGSEYESAFSYSKQDLQCNNEKTVGLNFSERNDSLLFVELTELMQSQSNGIYRHS